MPDHYKLPPQSDFSLGDSSAPPSETVRASSGSRFNLDEDEPNDYDSSLAARFRGVEPNYSSDDRNRSRIRFQDAEVPVGGSSAASSHSAVDAFQSSRTRGGSLLRSADEQRQELLRHVLEEVEGLFFVGVGGTLVSRGLNRGGLTGVLISLCGAALAYYGVEGMLESAGETRDPQPSVYPPRRPVPQLSRKPELGRAPATPGKEGSELVTRHSSLATRESLMNELERTLAEALPSSPNLALQASGTIQGLVNSLRWAVLASAGASAAGPRLQDPVLTLVTNDHFGSKWINRSQIVARIKVTAGISAFAAETVLQRLEHYVEEHLSAQGSVELAHIGRIERSGNGYAITLSDDLAIRPRRLVAA
jgi:hypothetical protein